MKFRLVETMHPNFDASIELEYEASDVCYAEDADKVHGYVTITIDSSDVMEAFWDFMTEDKYPPLTEEQFELFAEDDIAYNNYVRQNFDMLYDKYEQDLLDRFKEEATDYLYKHWDKYSDKRPFSQWEEDNREFWRNVWF